jgi:predicted amidohydrolase
MSQFAIAGLQLALANGDNLSFILDEIEKIKQRFPWVKMVVLSELATFGANPGLAQPIGNEAEQAYCAIAKKLSIWLIPGSLYEQAEGKVFNSAPVINDQGEVITRYRKMYPFLPYEVGVTAGSEFVTFDVPDVGRFGISICYDKWFPETTRALVCQGAEVIIHPTLTTTIDRDVELAIARSNAATNQCYFFDINTAAPFAFGRSTVIGPGGEVIHEAGSSQEVFPIEIDLDYVRRVRERGWQGLCQVLKVYRDSGVIFPQYQPDAALGALADLGKLERPK